MRVINRILLHICWKIEDIIDYLNPNNSFDISVYFENKVYGYRSYKKPINIKDWYARACSTGYWGEIDRGWIRLISNLCKNIIELDSSVIVIQVKQKFGSLHFYYSPGRRKKHYKTIRDLIYLAERTSTGICENCGSLDRVSSSKCAYIQSLCPKCQKELYND